MKLARDLTCSEIVELVTDYLEGGLSAQDRDRFEEHIGSCDLCLTYLDQMRQTIATVGRLREDELTPEVRDGLLHAFRKWTGA